MALLCGVDVGSRAVRAVVLRTGIKRTFTIERLLVQPVTIDPSGATARDEVVAAIRMVVDQLPPNIDEIHAALREAETAVRASQDSPGRASQRG